MILHDLGAEVVALAREADGLLPVIRPDPSDPIFAGIAGQFGATWFQGRIACFDYRRGQFSVLDAVPAPRDDSGLGPQSRRDEPERWLPIAQGTTTTTAKPKVR